LIANISGTTQDIQNRKERYVTSNDSSRVQQNKSGELKMYFKLVMGRRAASCWALPHISSYVLLL